jgi:hypothetical protein
MSWDELRKELGGDYESQQIKITQLNEAEKKKALDLYLVYDLKETKKKAEERKFYKDDKGANIITIRFPKKSFLDFNRPIAAAPIETKKGGWQWWGIQLPLMKKNGKNPVATLFLPGLSKEMVEGFWEPEDKKRMIVFRGVITRKFRWIGEKEYHRPEATFIIEARKRFGNPEIDSIDDIDDSEIDSIKYTFNAEQKLKEY